MLCKRSSNTACASLLNKIAMQRHVPCPCHCAMHAANAEENAERTHKNKMLSPSSLITRTP
eukprot:1877759-Amphidinium_carterae.1